MHISVEECLRALGTDKYKDVPFHVLYDSLLLNGDCSLDAWQGIHWLVKNSFLLSKPHIKYCAVDAPVIACGSGPSLTRNIDRIRSLKDRCYIIAAESTAPILYRAGIMPDMVTPIERCDQRAQCLVEIAGKTMYGGHVFVPHYPHMFKRHMLVGSSCALPLAWAGVHESCHMASSSGGQAVANAIWLTRNRFHPVYLVGHDCCAMQEVGSNEQGTHHADGYWNPNGIMYDMGVLCHDGKTRVSTTQWWRNKEVISAFCEMHPNVVNVARKGAVIRGVTVGDLPNPKKLPKAKPKLMIGQSNHWDAERFRHLVKTLPDDMAKSLERCDAATDIKQVSAQYLCDTPNRMAINYYCLPIWAQLSIEARVNQRGEHLLPWCKRMYHNVTEQLIELAKDLARDYP